jgi:hypothetical protein
MAGRIMDKSLRFEVVKLLLDRDDIIVNIQDDEGKVPLYKACGRSGCVSSETRDPSFSPRYES